MPKYNVLIDSSIYRKSPSRSDLPFLALQRLCKAKIVQLHVPYIVEREFQTQQEADFKKELSDATKAVDSLLRKRLSASSGKRLKELRDELTDIAPTLIEESKESFDEWLNAVNAIRHPIAASHAVDVMEAYFAGLPPFKAIKERKDIPDAFIFQCVKSIQVDVADLAVISADKGLLAGVAALPSIKAFEGLDQFVSTKEIQTQILEVDVIENLKSIALLVKEHEQEAQKFFDLVYNRSQEDLWQIEFISYSVPNEDNVAKIESIYGGPDEVHFDYDHLTYYGSGEFGLPFSFSLSVTISYTLFEEDFSYISKRRFEEIRLMPQGGHRYEAEEDVDLTVSGTMQLKIEPSKIRELSTSRMGQYLNYEIDSMDGIEFD